MPKIDPITGCSVLTFPEFLQAEAKREGKEAHEIMQELYQDMEDADNETRKDYHQNALKYLQQEAKELLDCWTEDIKYQGEIHEYNRWDSQAQKDVTVRQVYDAGPRPPQPTKLLEVIDVQFSSTFRSSQSLIKAKCEADDGKVYIYTLVRGDYAGSFYEPPNADVDLKWEST